MASRNRSREVRTGRRRLMKLLAATGTLAGSLWITSPGTADERSSDVVAASQARAAAVCRVLGLQRRTISEPRAWQVQPCQALAPVIHASAQSETTAEGQDGSADASDSRYDGQAPTESAPEADDETSVRLLRPVPNESGDGDGSESPSSNTFSPFRSAAPVGTSAAGADSSTSFDAGDRSADRSPDRFAPAPTVPADVAQPDGAAVEHGPVGGRRTARASAGAPAQRPDASQQTMQALQDLQAAQSQPNSRRPDNRDAISLASGDSLYEVVPECGEMSVAFQESKMLRLREPVSKVAVVDPSVCEVVQFSPREICLLGKSPGATNISFWVGQSGGRPATYRVTVEADQRAREMLADEYRQFEQLLSELFPQAKVRLLLVADKVIVKGEASDETEAMRILSVLRQANAESPASFVSAHGLAADFGPAARLSPAGGEQARSVGRLQLINMLQVAGQPHDMVATPAAKTTDAIRSAKRQ